MPEPPPYQTRVAPSQVRELKPSTAISSSSCWMSHLHRCVN
nr:MAG TPA: hypothetical protein [Bacteriophage sp.]